MAATLRKMPGSSGASLEGAVSKRNERSDFVTAALQKSSEAFPAPFYSKFSFQSNSAPQNAPYRRGHPQCHFTQIRYPLHLRGTHTLQTAVQHYASSPANTEPPAASLALASHEAIRTCLKKLFFKHWLYSSRFLHGLCPAFSCERDKPS